MSKGHWSLLWALSIVLVLLVAVGQVKADALMVYDNQGGNLSTYARHASMLEDIGVRVAIAGECYSACVLYTNPNLDVCVLPGARLGFHKPFAMNEDGIVYGDEYTIMSENVWRTILGLMREEIQAILHDKYIPSVYTGDSQQDLYIIEYDELVKVFGPC